MTYEIDWTCDNCRTSGTVTVPLDYGPKERFLAAIEAHDAASLHECAKLPYLGRGEVVDGRVLQRDRPAKSRMAAGADQGAGDRAGRRG